MAKKNSVLKATHAVSNQGRGQTFEQHESYDDSLLPDADELRKLKELDEDAINWIKKRTEKEQDFRHNFHSRRMRVVEKGQRRSYSMDILTVLCAFFVIISGMAFSSYLIYLGEKLTGTFFAGGTIIFAANSFLKFRKKNNSQTPPKK